MQLFSRRMRLLGMRPFISPCWQAQRLAAVGLIILLVGGGCSREQDADTYSKTNPDAIASTSGAHSSPRRTTLSRKPPRPQRVAPTRSLKGKIVFASDRDGDYEIYVMRANGSRVRQLTHNTADDYGPAWSPDGRSIAFVRFVSRSNEEIFLMSAQGTAEMRVRIPSTQDSDPTWTPDGHWITYVGAWDGASVYMMRRDGTPRGAIVLEEDNSYMENPAWAPGGRRLVYTYEGGTLFRATCCEGRGRVSQADDDRRLARLGRIDSTSWSSDGEWILLSSDVGKGERGNHDIFIVRPGGKDLRKIDAHSTESTGADWGRGSHRFVFASDRKQSFDIFMMNRRGSKLWRLTHSHADEIDPDWWRNPTGR